MTSVMEENKMQQKNTTRHGIVVLDSSKSSPRYEDALFVVHVQPNEATTNSSTAPSSSSSSCVLTKFISPGGSAPLVVQNARGGMSARQPSRVQLFTKSGVSVTLFSHTLAAEAVADAFIACRDLHVDEPRARARALKEMLRDLHDAEHTFSLAVFDDSARAFVAWTPRSAPISFGHHLDGSVVVVGSSPRSKTLVGRQLNGDVQLAHLPAGRFVYGHAFLKPFEFTSMWNTATGNRAGAPSAVQQTMVREKMKMMTSTPLDVPQDIIAVDDLDKPKLSPEESVKWRWAKTGSRAEVANSWKTTLTTAAVAAEEAHKVELQLVPELGLEAKAVTVEGPVASATTRSIARPNASAASQIAAIAEAVAARTSSAMNDPFTGASGWGSTFTAKNSTFTALSPSPTSAYAESVAEECVAEPKENPAPHAAAIPAVAAATVEVAVGTLEMNTLHPVKSSTTLTPPTSILSDAAEATTQRLLTFGVGAVICHSMGLANTNHLATWGGGGPRINRFDTRPDKRFLTLLLLRVAVLTSSPFISPEERREQMLQAVSLLLRGGEVGDHQLLERQQGRSQRRDSGSSAGLGSDCFVAAAAAAVGANVLLGQTTSSFSSRSSSSSSSFAATMRRTAAAWSQAAAGGADAGTKKRSQELNDQAAAMRRRRRIVSVPVSLTGGNSSSVVICQLNGTCCVGSSCFV